MADNILHCGGFDLVSLGFLPTNWAEEILNIAEKFSVFTHLDGKSPTSLEPTDSPGVDVYVVTGDLIKEHLLWLHELYLTKLLSLAEVVAGQPMIPSADLQAGVNINFLKGTGARYEKHKDSNPLTGLLFVTTHDEEGGGALVFDIGGQEVRVYPKAGQLLLFDGRISHTVMALKRDKYRISIPMNYYTAAEGEQRLSSLNTYLYTAADSPNQP